MTTTLPSNVTALPANQDAPAMSARMAAFIAEELLPLMAGSWPASANQLDANARGVALVWGGVLRGFTPAQIREVVGHGGGRCGAPVRSAPGRSAGRDTAPAASHGCASPGVKAGDLHQGMRDGGDRDCAAA